MNAPLRIRRLGAAFLSLALALFAGAASAQEATSSGYVLAQDVVDTGGETATSTSFLLDGSTAQPATVGETTSTSFVLQSGFWNGLAGTYTLRIDPGGSGNGTITGPGIACELDGGVATGDCEETVAFGTTLDLVATPDPANQQEAWMGCDAVLTTNSPNDTCRVTLNTARTVAVSFTLLGTVGDRVWRDVDGDGVQDIGEPGLNGVDVTISDGSGSTTATTAGDGDYTFFDVPPGSYTVSIDTATLPAGVVPTYDKDGVATPHTTEITLSDGEGLGDVDFGYQPLVDLSVTVADAPDPLSFGDGLTYTFTVTNDGPGAATGVTLNGVLPDEGVPLVSTDGCAEDPVASPVCSLGTLGIGESVTVTVQVEVEESSSPSLTNTASVSSVEVDTDGSDNTASAVTDVLTTLEVVGLGSGMGTISGPGIACTVDGGTETGDCAEVVSRGTTVDLVATPDGMNRFDQWTGCDATSTTTVVGDTCTVTLTGNRTVGAAFTLLGIVGDRVWRDVDGDGVQDGDEPGIEGVTVTLMGDGEDRVTVTGPDGLYTFADVGPGTYEVAVDPDTLPPGYAPSYDRDGVDTPDVVTLTVTDGDGISDVDFGYQPQIDLALTKVASTDMLETTGELTWTLTVTNRGPADATDVIVNDLIPAGVTLIGTVGCAEDPFAVPTCSLGDLAVGESATYTIEVNVDVPTNAVSNTATVSALEFDVGPSNDTASVVTGASPVLAIPTASEYALALLALLLAGFGWFFVGTRPSGL